MTKVMGTLRDMRTRLKAAFS